MSTTHPLILAVVLEAICLFVVSCRQHSAPDAASREFSSTQELIDALSAEAQGRLTDEELKNLDKVWQRYRGKNGLDARAKTVAEPGGSPNASSAPLHQHR